MKANVLNQRGAHRGFLSPASRWASEFTIRALIAWTLGSLPLKASAQLQVVPDRKPQSVFAGEARPLHVVWRNDGDQPVDIVIGIRLLQAASATAAPAAEAAWKELHVLPHQTILESAAITFPEVTSATRFIVQWFADRSVLGTSEAIVYPQNLLRELQLLLGEGVLGILDPFDTYKPALRAAEIEVVDIDDARSEDFSGSLAIIASETFDVTQVQRLAKRGVAVVWVRPAARSALPTTSDKILCPSFFVVREKKTGIVVAEPELVAELAANPTSGLNLIGLARLALNPEPFKLPQTPASE